MSGELNDLDIYIDDVEAAMSKLQDEVSYLRTWQNDHECEANCEHDEQMVEECSRIVALLATCSDTVNPDDEDLVEAIRAAHRADHMYALS